MRRVVSYVDQLDDDPRPRFNLAMPNLHAAYALVSLEHGDRIAARLQATHEIFARAATEGGLAALPYRDGEVPTRCLLRASSGPHRNRVVAALGAQGVQASRELLSLCPPREAERYPAAVRLVEQTLSLPFHPALRDDEIARVVMALQRSGDA